MYECERAFERRIDDVGEHDVDLGSDQHALVDERCLRKARDIELVTAGGAGAPDFVFDAFADDVQLALECFGVARRIAAADEDLLDRRLRRERGRADRGVVRRYFAPAAQLQAFFLDDPREHVAASLRRLCGRRQEHEPRAVLIDRRQVDTQRRTGAAEEFVRHLYEDARTVAGIFLAAARAAVQQIFQHGHCVLDDRV